MLVAQQFWLFGCDIRRPEGNLLLAYGFDRRKAPPDTRITASRYSLPFGNGNAIILWGFGVMWSEPEIGDLYLSRHRFLPLIREHGTIPDDLWDPGDFEGFRRPVERRDLLHCQALVTDMARWMADYENFVLEAAGRTYRNQTIRAWKKPFGTASDLSGHWRQCARDLAMVAGVTPQAS